MGNAAHYRLALARLEQFARFGIDDLSRVLVFDELPFLLFRVWLRVLVVYLVRADHPFQVVKRAVRKRFQPILERAVDYHRLSRTKDHRDARDERVVDTMGLSVAVVYNLFLQVERTNDQIVARLRWVVLVYRSIAFAVEYLDLLDVRAGVGLRRIGATAKLIGARSIPRSFDAACFSGGIAFGKLLGRVSFVCKCFDGGHFQMVGGIKRKHEHERDAQHLRPRGFGAWRRSAPCNGNACSLVPVVCHLTLFHTVWAYPATPPWADVSSSTR